MKYRIYFKKLYHLKEVNLTIEKEDLHPWNGSFGTMIEKLTGKDRFYDYRIDLFTNQGRLVYERKNRLRYVDFEIYPIYNNIFEKLWLKLKCKLGFHYFKNYQLSSCHLNTTWGSLKCGHSGYYCSQPQFTCQNWVVQCDHCGKKRFADEIF